MIALVIYCLSILSVECSSSELRPPELPSYLHKVLFAGKTPYKTSRLLFPAYAANVGITGDNLMGVENGADSNKALYPSECVPEQLSLVLRHGTRYPSKGDVKRITKFKEGLQMMNISEEFLKLKKWQNPFDNENSVTLSEIGVQEMIDISQRFADKFPDMFVASVASYNFELVSSNKERTIASARAFVKGLSRRLQLSQEKLASVLSLRNDLIRFFEHCPRYSDKVSDFFLIIIMLVYV